MAAQSIVRGEAFEREVKYFNLVTFGCQMNDYDSHLVSSQLVAAGYTPVESWRQADVVLVNTCAVRGKPVEKAASLLGDLAKEGRRRPLTIGLLGCLAQLQEGRDLAEKFGVNLLVGPGAIHRIVPAVQAGRLEDLAFHEDLAECTPPPPSTLAAPLTIMRGCNHHCTYCIVPTTRGPEVSRSPRAILSEAASLREAGVLEVTLLGQNVNSYGLDRIGEYPSFARMLRLVGGLGIPRVKFITSHPVNFTDDIIQAIAETPEVCRYIHLPVQSGSDRVLKRMAREYRRDFYLGRIERIRSLIPEATISTDIIVGFPGETPSDFEETLSLYREVEFDLAYTFIYSARPGTPAHKHFQDLPREVKTERLGRLIELAKETSLRRNQAWLGRDVEVLIDGPAHEQGYWLGHDRGNHPVLVEAAPGIGPGIHIVTVDRVSPQLFFGHLKSAVREMIPLAMA